MELFPEQTISCVPFLLKKRGPEQNKNKKGISESQCFVLLTVLGSLWYLHNFFFLFFNWFFQVSLSKKICVLLASDEGKLKQIIAIWVPCYSPLCVAIYFLIY